jgi:hypothetical protein
LTSKELDKNLLTLHNRSCELFNTYNPWPDYNPHITVAFLREGEGAKYLENTKDLKIKLRITALHWRMFKEKKAFVREL